MSIIIRLEKYLRKLQHALAVRWHELDNQFRHMVMGLGVRFEKHSVIYLPVREDYSSDLYRFLLPVPLEIRESPQTIQPRPRVERIDNLWIIY